MNNNLHKIFSESGCPSSVTLQAYLENTLSGKERHLIEAHLIDCEMCSDELEGLSLLKNKEKLGDIVEEIKAQTVKKQAKVFHLNLRNRILAAAAVILLVAGFVFIIKNLLVTEEENYITQRYEPDKISQKPVESKPKEKMEHLQKPEEEIRAIIKEKIADSQIEMEEKPGPEQIEDVVTDDEPFDLEIAAEVELIVAADNIEPVKKNGHHNNR